MKRGFIISILAVSALFFVSCEKEQPNNTSNEPLPIFRGYMQFSTEVSTRAQLATNMRGKDFGVIGFQYSPTTDWGTAKSTATPMTDFFDQKVSCGSQGTCTYDVDGTKNGDQYKQWEENKYAFFAYYPYDGDGIELSSETAANTPSLTYTYPWAGRTRVPVYDPEINYGMYDLMTAEDLDCDGSRNVKLDFKHRLFAIEILANNYNETQFQYVYDTTKPVWEYVTDENGKVEVGDDGKPIIKTDPDTGEKVQAKNEDGTLKYEILLDENGHKVIATDANGNKIILTDPETGEPLDATTSISNLSVEISGLQYSSISIPMSKQPGEKMYISRTDPNGIKGKTIQFDIQDGNLTIPAFNDPIYDAEGKIIAGDGIATSISKLGTPSKNGYLMFIPQDEPIKFSLWWREIEAEQSIDRTIESTVKFEPGYLYQLIVNFVGSGITVHLIKVGAWDDQPVYHTFE